MSTTCRLSSISLAAMVAVLVGSSAQAALTSAEQKCIDGYNNKLRLVSATAGKDYLACVKGANKGDVANAQTCIDTDTPGKISGKEQKVTDLYTLGKCTGAEPIQQGAATGNGAHRAGPADLANDIFGDPVSGVVTPGSAESKCQQKAYQRAGQAFTEIVKAHRSCKKNGMKAGSITDETTLDATCGTFGQIDAGGKAAAKLAKISADVTAACGSVASLPATLPGLSAGCTASATAAGLCIQQKTRCRTCETLNVADGQSIDCDIFDDSLANGSCGIPEHKCVLDTTPSTDSQIQIHIAALPVPLTFGLSGALDIGAAGAVSTCDIQTLNPVNIPSIGVVCISPAGGCNPGVRHCGPGAGPALGVDVQSDGNIGACTSNAQCDGLAAAHCGGDDVLNATCTGFCSGTTPQACTNDADCLPSNGACNGPDPIGVNGGICQVTCIDTAAHGASDPGDIQCNLGSDLVVESAAPCNGTDVTIDVGSTCIPVSSQRATALISDANFTGGSFVPNPPQVNDLTGAPVACATVDSSTVTGLVGVGAVNFFGSALGDLSVGLKATCN